MKLRYLRGGGWNTGPVVVRSVFRYKIDPSDRCGEAGFRVIR